jgi:redox-sensing transcriptional repressor
MNNGDVPDIVIHRLPLYLRALDHMAESGQMVTSSQELGQRLAISSAQIRKDLSHFGEFGKQGTGYDIEFLRAQLRRILQVDESWSMALVGAGALGHALINYGGFRQRNFHIDAVFDNDPQKIGTMIGHLRVEDQRYIPERVRELDIYMAIIAAPASVAQTVADMLIQGGVRAILCYAPITLNLPEDIAVEYIDPLLALQSMTYYITRRPVSVNG